MLPARAQPQAISQAAGEYSWYSAFSLFKVAIVHPLSGMDGEMMLNASSIMCMPGSPGGFNYQAVGRGRVERREMACANTVNIS